jgi:hypothetical protein
MKVTPNNAQIRFFEAISLVFGGRMSKNTNLVLDSWEVSVNTTKDMRRLYPEHKHTAMCQTRAVAVFCVLASKEIAC